MKKIITTFFVLFIAGIGTSFRDFSEIYKTSNNEQIIVSVDMLDKYVLKLKNQLINFKIKYNIEKDVTIDAKIDELQRMSIALKKIENANTDENIAKNVIKTVISNLKNINSTIKPYLQEKIIKEQNMISDFKEKYRTKLKDFANKIKDNSLKIKKKINAKPFLTKNDEEILSHLQNLINYSNNIKKTNNTNFETIYNLKSYIINNMKSTLNEINTIKGLL